MTTYTSHKQGTFCWTDLSTPDPATAKKFYVDLFGWTFEDVPMGPEPGTFYTMFQKDGKSTAALFQQMPDQKQAGIPPHWQLYIAVDNVDASTKKAASLGGEILMEPIDVTDSGRMSILQDPSGAVVSLWQAKKHIGTEIKNTPGSMSWVELMTGDTQAAKTFYMSLLGITADDMDMGPFKYTIFKAGEEQVAGMMPITPDMGPVPPHWMIYFSVANTVESAAQATASGAKFIVPPKVIPNIGTFSILIDPTGAPFSILDSKF